MTNRAAMLYVSVPVHACSRVLASACTAVQSGIKVMKVKHEGHEQLVMKPMKLCVSLPRAAEYYPCCVSTLVRYTGSFGTWLVRPNSDS
jgi:hypothetical protein